MKYLKYLKHWIAIHPMRSLLILLLLLLFVAVLFYLRKSIISKLKNICIESKVIFSADIPYLGNNNIDKKVKYLIESWEVQIRYSIKLSKNPIANLSQNDIINLVELCEEILNKITTKYS